MSCRTNPKHAWNAGLDEAEFVSLFGQATWDSFKALKGESCFSVSELSGIKPKEITDPVRRRHLGLDGPGALLRKLIAETNREVKSNG